MLRIGFLGFVFLLSVNTDSLARDLFVNNMNGDDRHNGQSERPEGKISGPVRSIGRALQIAKKRDRIVIANTGVPYRESVSIQGGHNSGYETNPFVIEGNGAVLDGSAPIPGLAWEQFRGHVFRYRPTRFQFQQIFIDDVPAQKRSLTPTGNLPHLQPLEWTYKDHYVYFRTKVNRVPAQYKLTHASLPVGITIYEARHLVILDLTVQGYQLDGVNAHDSVFDAALVGLVCRGNGRSGISVGGASRVLIRSCLVGNNGGAQVRTEGESKTRIVESDLIDNTAPKVVQEGGEVTIEKPVE